MTESVEIIVADAPRRQPVLAGTAITVGDIVHACHQTTIADALATLSISGLTEATLDPILTYCAERRCQPEAATCPGCKRRSEDDGITSLDAFIASHDEIVVGDGTVRLKGQGTKIARTPDLATLEKQWSGENYWFWARRVLRKLRHGVRRAGAQPQPFAGQAETPTVILVGPQLADNIGMSARAMGNFGLDDMRVVAPRDGWPNEKARIAASGANHIIDEAKSYPNVSAAIADLHWVAATTARQRWLKKPVMTPAEAAHEMAKRIAAGQRCGVLFGRESSGLSGDELADADVLIAIPVRADFASLNLAQAVLILGYAWMLTRPEGAQSLGRVTTYEAPRVSGLNLGRDAPAEKAEIDGLVGHLEAGLVDRGFFAVPERRATVMRNVRTMFARMAPTDREVRTLRGIVATLTRARDDR